MDLNDGIHGMLPREKMTNGAKKLRDAYERKPNAPIYQKEFGYYSLERWISEGKLDGNLVKPPYHSDKYLKNLFGLDEPGTYTLRGLGGTTAEFNPFFKEKIIEDRGEHEVVRDKVGRHVLFFKGKRQGFMPEYIDHPVKDNKSWEELCKWRLDPKSPERNNNMEKRMSAAQEQAKKGLMISERMSGGYMFLRSLIGPVDLLYMLYDQPDLIHDIMKTWLELSDSVLTKYQEYITFDEIFFVEDICYNQGPLISPDMIREFLFPYYQQLLHNIKARQLDKNRHLYLQLDSDGYAVSVIPLYQEIGFDVMSPFEVASGCDVVQIGKDFPDLIISGGIDKRILAEGKDSIDRHIDSILPAMKKRGGYIPTCDHGVPPEVSFENYLHYRKRCMEFAE